MKKMEKYIVRNWIWLVTGLIYYLFRRAVNATTMLRKLEKELKEEGKCAVCV